MTTLEAETPLPDGGLSQGQATRLLMALFAAFATLCVLAVLLPHDPYIRYQQLRHTIQFRSQWVYERIELDPTPIDVAVIGNSRMGAGVSAPQLQAALRARTGADVHVANLSLPQEGRNVHYVVVKRLLAAHPEVKTLIVSVVEQMPRRGHPAFRDLADAGDVAAAPILLNNAYADDVAVLPYRQMSLFVQTLAPRPFGVTRRLSPDYLGADLDTTVTFNLPDGRVVDRDRVLPVGELMEEAEREIYSGSPQMLPPQAADFEFAVERTYTRKIAELAARHGVRIVFLHLPIYSDSRTVADAGFYERIGPILWPDFLASDPAAYSDYGHLNRRGSAQATAWLADRLAALGLPPTEKKP